MFREQIRKHYDHLSRSYRRVADFILSDYRTAAFMTAAALADAVDVDTTTVVRFAQRLGYPGFPELIEDIQEQVKLELSQTYATPSDDGGLYGKVQIVGCQETGRTSRKRWPTTPPTRWKTSSICCGQRRASWSPASPLPRRWPSRSPACCARPGLPVVYTSGDVYDRAAALSRVVRKEVVIGMTPVEGPSGVARVLRYARAEGAHHAGLHAEPEQPGRPCGRASALRARRNGRQPAQPDRSLRALHGDRARHWPGCSRKLHPSDPPRSPTPCRSCRRPLQRLQCVAHDG